MSDERKPAPPQGPQGPRWDANLAVLAFIVVFMIACTWLLIAFHKASQTEDCLAAGHPNCVPLDLPRQ